MDIEDNLRVRCSEEIFELSLRSEDEPADCYVYMQGSDKITGAFRIHPGKWTTYTCGFNGLTFAAIHTNTQDARQVGIKEGSESNALIKFLIHRPVVKVAFVPVMIQKSMHSSFQSFSPARETYRSCSGEETMKADSGPSRETTRGEKSLKSLPVREMAIAHGGVSSQKLCNAADMEIDPNRSITFYARMINRPEIPKATAPEIASNVNIPYASNVGQFHTDGFEYANNSAYSFSVPDQVPARRDEDDVIINVIFPDGMSKVLNTKRKYIGGHAPGCTIPVAEFVRLGGNFNITQTHTTTITYIQPPKPKYTPITGAYPSKVGDF